MSNLALRDRLPLSENPASVMLMGLDTRNTRRAYTRCLSNIASIYGLEMLDLDWRTIRYQEASTIRAMLIDGYESASTINQHLSALRRVLKESWLLGNLESDEYQRIKETIQNVKEVKDPVGRYVSNDELNRLLDTCDDTQIGWRDRAMFLIASYTGMRISEVINLNVEDFGTQDASLLINKAKGNKSRTVYIAGRALEALTAWLNIRNEDKSSDALFCTTDKARKRMTGTAVRKRLAKAIKLSGVDYFTFHSFRRKFISDALDLGVDETTIVGFTGHASKDMLTKYNRRGERAKQNAAQIFADNEKGAE